MLAMFTPIEIAAVIGFIVMIVIPVLLIWLLIRALRASGRSGP